MRWLLGSGDKNQVKFTNQSVANLIKQFGINLPPNVDPKLKNVAAVTVTASIPASYSPGQSLDVTVSSLGDAKSLRGGQLLLTPLMGVDGEVYALAQGAVGAGMPSNRASAASPLYKMLRIKNCPLTSETRGWQRSASASLPSCCRSARLARHRRYGRWPHFGTTPGCSG